MLKVTIKENTQPTKVTLGEMPVGSVGVDVKGNIYLRTNETATCVNNIDETFPSVRASKTSLEVTLLPKGSIITLEVQ